jgi:hypothetical protein
MGANKMATEENQIRIVWSPEDIQELCPNMSDEEAIEALNTIRDTFKDRATEEGWNILEGALDYYGYLEDEEEEK